MKYPNAWYIGDTATTMNGQRLTTVRIHSFLTGDTPRVRCVYPDGTIKSKSYEALSRPLVNP